MNDERVKYFEDLPVGIEIRNIEFCPWHRHSDAIEVMFVLNGTLEITQSCNSFTMNKNDVAVMDLNTFHNARGIDKENAVISMYIDPGYFEKYYQYIKYIVFILDINNRKDELECRQKLDAIGALIAKIAVEIMDKSEGFKSRVLGYLMDIVTELVTTFNEVSYYNPNIKFNSVKMERYYLIRKYLDENFRNKTVLEDIASKEFFCKSYLSHLFRDVSTFSLKDIVGFIRNWNSEVLLLKTKKSISQISEECGYSDPKYYYKHFKRWYTCTPSEYRKKYKAEIRMQASWREIKTDAVNNELKNLLRASKYKQGEKRQYGYLPLFEDRFLCKIDHEQVGINGNEISDQLKSLHENNMIPFITMDFKRRSEVEWKNLIMQSRDRYGSDSLKDWEFWVTYRDPGLLGEIRSFIDVVEEDLGDINLKFIWTP